MKPVAFWFHYNKPASQQAGRPVISVHFNGACALVDNVSISVPIKGRVRPRQPYFVLAGRGVCCIFDGIFYAGRA